jgi:hypothetical protein
MGFSRNVVYLIVGTMILLTAGCGMRRLEGTITGTDSKPLADCAVTLKVGTNGGLQLTRITDSVGAFSFGSVSTVGGCAIRVEKPGYESNEVPCPSDGSPIRVELRESGHAI